MIVILGGGISGLSVAHELKKAGKNFILLEREKKAGGKILSLQKQEYTLELGPNTVLINNKEIKDLIDELGLSKQLVFPEPNAVNNRFVLKNNNLEPFPNSLSAALKSRLLGFTTLYSILKEPFIKARKGIEEESLAQFIRRRLGQQILDDFITPFVTGIYAGDPEKMSADYTMNILKEAEQEHGSIIKGMMKVMKEKKAENKRLGLPKQKIFTFKKGLQTLIEALEKNCGSAIEYGTLISSIHKKEDFYEINYTQDGTKKSIKAEAITSCLPAHALANISKNLSESLSNKLSKINYVPAVTLHISFPSSSTGFKHKAFGILSRSQEKVPFLGVLFSSHFFPHTAPSDKELLTVICGGNRYPELIDKEDKEIISEVNNSIRNLLNINSEIETLCLNRWKRGIPQYELGYSEIEKEIDQFLDENSNFYIAANYYKGISVSDCVKNGTLVARKLIQ